MVICVVVINHYDCQVKDLLICQICYVINRVM